MTLEGLNTEENAGPRDWLPWIAEELAQVQACIGPHFRRAQTRTRAGSYLQGLLAPLERKNGWQVAEALGEHGPRGVQRLLGEADWDEEAVRDALQAYVVEHLGEEQGILVVDETSFVQKGKKSAGVARQYSGTAGRRENSQIGVFLLYAASRGAAFLDRALYLPEEWTTDRVRCREVGIPDEVGFATKGELARRMLSRALAAGMLAEWVVGDTVYGYEELRLWLDEQQKHYGVAVPETHLMWQESAWVVLSAGEGRKGPRLYEWAWLQVPEQSEAGSERARWILIRRSLVDPSERAYYRAAGPASSTHRRWRACRTRPDTRLALAERRWPRDPKCADRRPQRWPGYPRRLHGYHPAPSAVSRRETPRGSLGWPSAGRPAGTAEPGDAPPLDSGDR